MIAGIEVNALSALENIRDFGVRRNQGYNRHGLKAEQSERQSQQYVKRPEQLVHLDSMGERQYIFDRLRLQ